MFSSPRSKTIEHVGKWIWECILTVQQLPTIRAACKAYKVSSVLWLQTGLGDEALTFERRTWENEANVYEVT